jgi:hypothetical protein
MKATLSICFSLMFLTLGALAAPTNSLEGGFQKPPEDAKPWVFMWWFGTITPANITQHLEELKAKGVGGVLLFDLGGMPGVPFLSDKWRELFRHTVKETDRLGLKMGCNVCAGWPSGGTWIAPEDSSWMMVSSVTVLKGPQKYAAKLTEAPGKGTLYADVSVQAFRISEGDVNRDPVITVSENPAQIPCLLDGNYNTGWHSGVNANPWIVLDYGSPRIVDWMWVDVIAPITLEASADGITYTPVFNPNAPVWHSYEAVPSTTARWFRINVPNNVVVRDIALGTKGEVDRIAGMAAKRGHTHPLGVTGTRQVDQIAFVRQDLQAQPTDSPLNLKAMIELTAKCAADGTLTWDIPEGTWKIVRVGRTTTGIGCGGGLLSDYLSKTATEVNFDKALKLLIEDAGPLAGKTFQYFHEDNVELEGMYSWTPKFLEEFRQRRSYDPAPYLAALAGEIVDSLEITERFLADVRRTIADCVAEYHYGAWAELSHGSGMKVRAEAGGQHHPRLLCNDGLMNQGRMDVPVAEFWENSFWKENQFDPRNHHGAVPQGWDEAAQNVNAKQMASAAHLYGKRLAASESFTSLGQRAHWRVGPADLLPYANIAFCEGVNAMTLHGSATSGPEIGMPGNAFVAGTHFNHNITWWEKGAAPFLSYLARCQHLLRQGLSIADVLYYSGDEVPNYVPPKHIDPSRGFGYDYDTCNTEILLTRLSVKDGRIVLPDGISYRMLVLPERPVIPLAVAEKIDQLVSAGATVLGPRPVRTPGLTGYPQSEARLKAIAEKLWDRQACGKGRVVYGPTIRETLEKDGVAPDFAFKTEMADSLMDFIHRREGDTDIYFVINRRAKTMRADCTFRASGRPEFWDPITGKSRPATEFTDAGGCTVVPMEFGPYGSMFVMFQNGSQKKEDGSPKRGKNFPEMKPVMEFTGRWEVRFDPKWFYPTGETADTHAVQVVFEKLEDWTKRPEKAIKYYSGTATYRIGFESEIRDPQSRIFLDLGMVNSVASTRLNGKDLGAVWCPPYRLEVTEALQSGKNLLEIDVVNLWANRLIGDGTLPEADRRTRTNAGGYPQELLPSGLLGPVRLLTTQPVSTH